MKLRKNETQGNHNEGIVNCSIGRLSSSELQAQWVCGLH